MQLIVLGMHRSGTSPLTRLLNLMGAYVGAEGGLMAPTVSNPKGHWERLDVYQLHQEFFKTVGVGWQKVCRLKLAELRDEHRAAFTEQARLIVHKLDAYRPWVLKDPRLCLLLPLWRELLEVPICVYIYRSPLQVAQSLHTRDGFAIRFGLALWEYYNLAALQHSVGLPRVLVAHHELMLHPVETVHLLHAELERLGVRGLRLPSAQEICSFIESGLYRERGGVELEEEFATPTQLALFRAFEERRVLEWETAPALSAGAWEALQDYEAAEERATASQAIEAALQVNVAKVEQEQGEVAEHSRELEMQNIPIGKANVESENEREDTTLARPALLARKYNILVVGHLAPEVLYGGERSLLDVIRCIDTDKFNIFCTFPAYSAPIFNEIKDRVKEIVTFRYRWTRGLNFSSESIAAFKKLIVEKSIDLVYVNTIMVSEPLLAAKSAGVANVMHVREIIDKDPYLKEVIGLPDNVIVKNITENADYIIGNSEATRKLFDKKEKTFLVYNGIDTDRFDLRSPVVNGALRVGLISNNRPKKGIYHFAELAKSAYSLYPRMEFFLIGQTNDYILKLQEEQKQGEWTPNLRFLGYIDDPVDCYKKVDVVVNFSYFAESFGRTIVEAMACRRPVIGYAWGALCETILHNQSGYLIPYLCWEKALEYLGEMYGNEPLIHALGERGREHVIRNFSLSSLRRDLNHVYETILARPSPKTHSASPWPQIESTDSLAFHVPQARSQKSNDWENNSIYRGQRLESHLVESLRKRREKLHIAYFLWHFPAPSETFVLNELRYLVKNGYDVKVYCRQSPYQGFEPDFPIEYRRVRSPEELAQLLIQQERNIVHAHFVYPTVTEFVLPACEEAEIPFTFIGHGQDLFRYENMQRNRIKEVASSPWCLRVFVPGRFHREFLIEQGVPSEKIIINPQGIDVEDFANGHESEDRFYRKKMAVCAVQRFVEKKGLETLLRAGKLLADLNVTVNIYGYGPLEDYYREILRTEQINNVKLRGELNGKEAVREVLLNHDLLIAPSVRAKDGDMDGIPTVLMEAMAAGLPVLTTPISSIPDLVQDGITGFHCSPNDEDSLTTAIREFYQLHPERLRTITTHARAVIREKYAIDRCVRTLLRVWRRDALDIVLVTYKNLAGVREVIRRLYTYTPTYFHLIVVDNNSDDETVGYLRDLARITENLTLLTLENNVFVGPGTNLAIEQSHSPYVAYLCSKEAFVTNFGWDQHLMNYMEEHPEVGIAGHRSYSPSYLTGQMYKANLARFPEFRNQDFAEQHPTRLFCHIQGGLFILRRAMYEQIGGFSEEIPHEYTDVEYSYYAESCGWKLGGVPHILALYYKTRPPLEARFDEYVLAAHPPTLESGPVLDRIVERTVHKCNICGWVGSDFHIYNKDRRACPECGSLAHHRTLYRFLADSLLIYRQLKCLYINSHASLEGLVRKMFACQLVSVEEVAHKLASGGLENATASMNVAILSQILCRIENDHQLLSEVYRVLRPDATLLVQSPYEGLENQSLVKPDLEGNRRIYSLAGLHQLLHNAGFKVMETVVYPSGVLGYDWFQLFHCTKQT